MPSMDTNSLGIFKEVSEDNINRKNCLHRISGTTGESLSLRVASGVSLKPPIKDGTLDPLLCLDKSPRPPRCWKVPQVLTAPSREGIDGEW